jgi:hypothetical protein
VFVYECFLDTGDIPNLSTRGIDILNWSRNEVSRILGTPSIFEDADISDEIDGLKIANESFEIEIKEQCEFKVLSEKKYLIEKW